MDGTWTNNGLICIVTSAQVLTHTALGPSSDGATPSQRPKLVVDYTEASGGNPWHAYAQQ